MSAGKERSNHTEQRESAIDEVVFVIEAPSPGLGNELVAVLAQPLPEEMVQGTGVVIVVGGPQTRVGSHRQFVLMSRALARAGYPCLRFDYTGMGDSPGPKPDFESAGADIRRACDALLQAVPACRRIVLWGLCDGASAALFHARSDERIAAVIAANPWARSAATQSAAIVSEHYGSRLRSREFWKKLATGKINVLATAREALGHAWQARRSKASAKGEGVTLSLPARLAAALASPRALVHLQISGRDLTAAEFELAMKAADVMERSPATTLRLHDADHTFSDPAAWEAVIADTRGVLSRL
jgi:exosortase A-associated hydrolase 1